MDLLALGLVFVIIVAGGIWFVESLLRDTAIGVAAVLGLSVTVTFLDSARPTPVLAGITLLPEDLIFALIAAVGVLRLLRVRSLHLGQRLLLVLVALVALSALRGIGPNGFQNAFRESREFLYYFGGALYFSTADLTESLRKRIAWIFVGAAGLFALTAVMRWGALVVGIPPTGIFTRAREAGGIRVIDNQNTLMVTQGLFLMMPAIIRGSSTRLMRAAAIGLLPVIVLLQHRTIWIVVLYAAAVLAIRNPRFGRVAVAVTVGAVAIVAIVTAALSTGSQDSLLPQDPTSADTFIWRFEGWQSLLSEEPSSAENLVLGRPMGGGYQRELRSFGYDTSTVPHNFYVQTYLRLGIGGFAAFVALLWMAGSTLRRQRHEGEGVTLSGEALFLMLTMQAVFMIAWTPDMDQGVITGLALAHAFRWTPDMVTELPQQVRHRSPLAIGRRA